MDKEEVDDGKEPPPERRSTTITHTRAKLPTSHKESEADSLSAEAGITILARRDFLSINYVRPLFMYQIDIANSQDCLEVDEAFLTLVTERVLAEEQVATAEISIALVDNATIHELNRQYLNHDYATDVLSFLLDCEPAETVTPPSELPPTQRGQGKRLDGEVIISTETALQDAEKFGWSPREEVVLYLIHGVLHLVGYDDLSSTEQVVMRARERAMLAEFHITPPPNSLSTAGEAPTSLSEQPETPPDDPPHSRRTES